MSRQLILKLQHIQKKYDDGFLAIKDFDLDVYKSEFVTLLGPSGCGKTTLLKIIGGFEQLTKGKILYNGIDIKDLSITQRPTSTVFQDYALFPNMTVEQNIKYGLKLMRTELENIPDVVYKNAEKIYRDCLKIKNKKIKEINKEKNKLSQQIQKLEKKYNKNEFLYSIKDMRISEYHICLELLYQKLEEDIENGYQPKITFKERFLEFLNSLSFAFKINKYFKINMNNKTETEKEIILTKRWFRYKTPIDKKLDKLNDKYNDLDYWVSYWETYPDIKKEEFEKRNITRRLNKEEIDEKFKKVISLVGLQGKENSYPSDLSGGMQQRVALARSIVIEPEIILLDEPLSALDAKVRQQLQAELKRLHKELGITFILVTHDQEEALMLSDKIVVMSEGKIEQIGTPEEIYDTPQNLWVAKFIGKTNIYKTEDTENKYVIFCDYKFDLEIKNIENKEAYFLIRPEDFSVVDNQQGMINDVFVKSVNYSGLFYDLECISHNNQIINIKSITFIKPETKIGLNINKDNIHIIYEEIEKDEDHK